MAEPDARGPTILLPDHTASNGDRLADPPACRSRWLEVARWVVPPLLLLCIGALLFSSAGRDDSHITFWAAHALAQEGQVLNYNGERVEQSSSLLHVVFLALLKKVLPIEMVTLAFLVSIGFGMACVSIAMLYCRHVDSESSLTCGILTALSVYLVYWSFGGLETTLQTMLYVAVAWSFTVYLDEPRPRQLVIVAVPTLFATAARPEGFVVLPAVVVGFLSLSILFASATSVPLKGRHLIIRLTAALRLMAVTWVAAIIVFGFRLFYFHEWFPQPVVAKSIDADPLVSFLTGARYVVSSFSNSIFGLIYALLSLTLIAAFCVKNFAVFSEKIGLAIAVSFATTQLAFAVTSGGDWMEGARFLAPMTPFVAILLAVALVHAGPCRRLRAALITALVATQLAWAVDFAFARSTGMPLWSALESYRTFGKDVDADALSWFERTNRVHMRDIPILYRAERLVRSLKAHENRPIVILSSFMGMVPYHLTRRLGLGTVRFIDCCAIVENSLTDCVVTSDSPRTPYGLILEPIDVLDVQAELQTICDVPRPDIVIGIFRSDELFDRLRTHGYQLFYRQENYVARTSGIRNLGGITFDKVFIAVADEHYGAAHQDPPP